jgi:all-trans-retinol 13,14-reductase
MGGLASAALLSKAGKSVLVLERHYTMGGFTHTFRRKAYEWDVGVHYVGEFHRKGTVPQLLFDDISGGSVDWAPMPANYDRIIFPDGQYDFVAGSEEFVEEISRDFPTEHSAIAQYVEMAHEAYAAAMTFFQHKALPPFLAWPTRPFLCRKFLRFSDQTTLTALRRLTDDANLIGVLSGQWGTYGLPPAESSFGIHAIVASHYMEGAAYPVGGSGSIARGVLPTIEDAGGTLLVAAEVESIMTLDGRAVGVRMKSGQEISAPAVISDAGIANTLGGLIEIETRGDLGLDEKLTKLRPSVSHICLYVGLAEPAERLGLKATNRWIYPSYDHDRNVREFDANPEAPFPVVYISFPSAKDPSWSERHGDTATLEMISFAPFDWFQPWEDERWMKRGERYQDLKASFSARLLEVLYEHVPETKGKVAYCELSTPLSTKHFANYGQGEIYGVSFTPDRFRIPWLSPRTPIKGLYLTGQDTVAHGVVGALYSGLVTASVVLGRNVLKDVRRRSR